MTKSAYLFALAALLTACGAPSPKNAPADLPADSIASLDTLPAQSDYASVSVPSGFAIATTPGGDRYLYDLSAHRATYALSPDEDIHYLVASSPQSAYFTLYTSAESFGFQQIVDQSGRRILTGPASYAGLGGSSVRASLGLEERVFDLGQTKPGTQVMTPAYPALVRQQSVQESKVMDVVAFDDEPSDRQNTVYLNLLYEVPAAATPAAYAMGTWVLDKVIEPLDLMDSLNYHPVVRTRDDYSIVRETLPRRFFAANDSVAAYSSFPVGIGVYLSLRWCEGDFYTYYRDMQSFTGGAHGYYMQNYFTYDMQAGCPLTASRLFRPEAMPEVRRLLLEKLAADRSQALNDTVTPAQLVEQYGDLVIDDTQPCPEGALSPVPALVPQGVVYAFQPYEYGSYAEGIIRAVLPYSEVKPLLRPEVVERLGL